MSVRVLEQFPAGEPTREGERGRSLPERASELESGQVKRGGEERESCPVVVAGDFILISLLVLDELALSMTRVQGD